MSISKEEMSRLLGLANDAKGLSNAFAPWYGRAELETGLNCDPADSAYIEAIDPLTIFEMIVDQVNVRRENERLQKILLEIENILDPTWLHGRILPAYVGAENQARINAIRGIIK